MDNSWSITLAHHPILLRGVKALGLLDSASASFVASARANKILRADATRRLPFRDESLEVVYTSHTLNCFYVETVSSFMREVYRVLTPGGIVRISLADLKLQAQRYLRDGDSVTFIRSLGIAQEKPSNWRADLKARISKCRPLRMSYDAETIVAMLRSERFVEATSIPAGQTRIPEPGLLDLFERAPYSFYVEAVRP